MKIIIKVEGGMVQAVYADDEVEVDVVDLDVSDFPDDGEQEAADEREEKLNKTVQQKGWKQVW